MFEFRAAVITRRFLSGTTKQQKPRLITFDAYDTLFHPRHEVGYWYKRAVEFHVPSIGSAAPNVKIFSKNFRSAFSRMSKQYPCYGAIAGLSAATWWFQLVQDTLYLSLHGILSESFLEQRMPLLFRDLYYDIFQSDEAWVLADGTKQLLEYLDKHRGEDAASVKIGIVSNSDDRTLSILKTLGISTHFDFVLTSYETKTEKPSPEIFKQAMQAAGIYDPRLCVHVGDSLESDVLGALQQSWRAIHVDQLGKVLPYINSGSIELAKNMSDVKVCLDI